MKRVLKSIPRNSGLLLALIFVALIAATCRWYICFWSGAMHLHSYPGGFAATLADGKRLDRPTLLIWRHDHPFVAEILWGRIASGHATGDAKESQVPIWPFACMGLALQCAVWLAAWRRRRRRGQGCCRVCGYDLRGNVSGRCPECGTVIPVSTSVTSSKR